MTTESGKRRGADGVSGCVDGGRRVESEKSHDDASERDGEEVLTYIGGVDSPAENGLCWARMPRQAGCQMDMLCTARNAWASSARKSRGSPRGNGLPNRP